MVKTKERQGTRWEVKQITENAHEVSVYLDKKTSRQRFLLRSDVHHDSIHCLRDMEKRHLEEAKEQNAGILDFGDLHDAMQGRKDGRGHKGAIREEYKRDDYFTALIEEAAKFYAPYKDQFVVIGRGNHETAIIRHNEIDLTSMLARELGCFASGYSGMILFRIYSSGSIRGTLKLWFFHGSGGGGPVTRGVIQTNRRAVTFPDADIIVTGHIHEAWHMIIPQARFTDRGMVRQAYQHHLQLPTYKDEFENGFGGWAIEKGMGPKPLGAWWMSVGLRWRKEAGTYDPHVRFEMAD